MAKEFITVTREEGWYKNKAPSKPKTIMAWILQPLQEEVENMIKSWLGRKHHSLWPLWIEINLEEGAEGRDRLGRAVI